MDYLHHELNISPDDIVQVTLDHAANVQLMDGTNFLAYTEGKQYRYYGGHVTHSPFRICAPQAGKWHLVVDLGGGPGRVRAAVQVISSSAVA